MMTEKDQGSDPPVQPTKPVSKTEDKPKPEEKTEDRVSALERSFETVESKVLSDKREALDKLEARVSKKIETYKKMVEEQEVRGESLQQAEKSPEDIKTENAMKLIAGTGLEDRFRARPDKR